MSAVRTWLTRQFVPFLIFPTLVVISAMIVAGAHQASTPAPMTLVVTGLTALLLGLGFSIDTAANRDAGVNPAGAFWTLMSATVIGLLGGLNVVGVHVAQGGDQTAAGFGYVGAALVLVFLGLLRDRKSIAYVTLGLLALTSLAAGIHWPILALCGGIAFGLHRGWTWLRRQVSRIPGLRHAVFTRARPDPA